MLAYLIWVPYFDGIAAKCVSVSIQAHLAATTRTRCGTPMNLNALLGHLFLRSV